MSQPEMRPEGARWDGQGDLLGRAFPLGDWGEPAERLDELYQWVEQGALQVIDWYLADRRVKRRAARAARLGVALGVAAGAVLPVLELVGAVADIASWGYLALLGAVLCAAADRWFGLTSGWMRAVSSAQNVQRRLEILQYEWASESVREVLGPTEGTASEAAERCLAVLRRFNEDITDLVRSETADWMVEFRNGPVPLPTRSASPTAFVPRPDRDSGGSVARFPMPPGARPNMPRQRPPENPR
ncbi:SLATT domain-containing protein [Streptomyces sp. 549]|uniref:SLATT domain-containing protein n=1 Tax=Streptomyces sp. 549 TaxID=3049076 RepID=UPI0024C3B845|nr:SLATT domain-containing protein [Streptomyces sp. 549]MDK1473045.1 SLATT domain-containing protein [Streptomyces sp. 549]